MQFSLRALLAVLVGISVLCALLFTVPDGLALLLLLVISCHATVAAVLGIIYFDGNIRAFSIGAAAGAMNTLHLNLLYSSSMVLEQVAALLDGVNSVDSVNEYFFGKVLFVYILGIYLSGGVMGVMARQVSERYRRGASNANSTHDADAGDA